MNVQEEWAYNQLREENLRLKAKAQRIQPILDAVQSLANEWESGGYIFSEDVNDKVKSLCYAYQEDVDKVLFGYEEGCRLCGGDCAGANPPVYNCPMK